MDYGRGDYNGDQKRVLATISIMMILSTVVFLLRLWARRISVARYWYDDYVVFLALVRVTRRFLPMVAVAVQSSRSTRCCPMGLPSVC